MINCIKLFLSWHFKQNSKNNIVNQINVFQGILEEANFIFI